MRNTIARKLRALAPLVQESYRQLKRNWNGVPRDRREGRHIDLIRYELEEARAKAKAEAAEAAAGGA